MRKTVSRYIAGIFAGLFLVFALSASQPSAVCAAVAGTAVAGAAVKDCSSDNTVMKCDGKQCCTVTKDASEFCGCNF